MADEAPFNAHFVMKSWRGPEVIRDAETAIANALGELALNVQGAAKGELYYGHGVKTATLQRSIHVALPGYPWEGDNCEPGPDTPERATSSVVGTTLEVGSGMDYAMAVHQGWGSFEGYHYLTNALNWARSKWSAIVSKYRF